MTDPESESPRQFARQRTLKGARIVCAGSLTFDVVIRDMSEGGVKLKLGSPFVMPSTFQLHIPNPNTGIAERRACKTCWQRGDLAGAQFITAAPEQQVQRLAAPSLRRPANPV